MAQTYTYSISVDFPNGTVAPSSLTTEINDSSISTGVLQYINVAVSAADNCDIVFDVALSAPDVTTLDGVVAAHQGIPLPLFVESDFDTATFQLLGASAPGIPMFTLCQQNVNGEFMFMENAIDNTPVVQFRQSATGNPIFGLRNAAGDSKIRLTAGSASFINSPNGLGIGLTNPDPIYAVDIGGEVNTSVGYRVAETVLVNSSRDLTNVRTGTFGAEFDNGSQAGPTYTVDWNAGQKQTITLTGNITTMSLTAPAGVGNFLLRVVQDGTGSRTITWPASVKWPGGTAPTLSTAASAEDIVTFYYNGTDYYGVGTMDFS